MISPRQFIHGWNPPEPSQLPEWRHSQIEVLYDPKANLALGISCQTGTTAMVPRYGKDGRAKAFFLNTGEANRLRRGDLYYVSDEMTALALNAAETEPLGKVRTDRIPSEYGFMVFGAPITSYLVPGAMMQHQPYHQYMTNDAYIPIIGASWGPFDPASHGGWERPRNSQELGDALGVKPVTRDLAMSRPGTWVTLYTYTGATYDTMEPGAYIGEDDKGYRFTAEEVMKIAGNDSPLSWDGEGFLAHGEEWASDHHVMAQPYVRRALNVVYTTWCMITDKRASGLVEQETLPRPRAGRKRDNRADILGSSDVRLVRVHSRHRPQREQVEEDFLNSDGRKPPQWTCRWPVRLHRRMQWYPSREDWEEILIYPYIKGPSDKPLRIRETVNVFDQMPEGEPE